MAGLEGGYGGGGAGEPSGAVGLVFVLERKMTEWAGGSMEGLNGGTEWGRLADVERFFFSSPSHHNRRARVQGKLKIQEQWGFHF